MREIKFRAWLPDSERMLEHDAIDLTAGEVFERVYYPDTGFMNAFKRKGSELMQFTGLHDKNGQEIYEGDVVREKYDNAAEIGEVIFDDGAFCVRFSDGEYLLVGCDSEETEIIGNRWQHPHLLEQANE